MERGTMGHALLQDHRILAEGTAREAAELSGSVARSPSMTMLFLI